MIGRGELKSRCGGRLFLLVRILSREDEGVEESCDLDARIGKQDQFFLFFEREPILSRLAEIAPSLFTLWQLLHNHY